MGVFITVLGGGFKYFLFSSFHPYLGKIPILTNIFQMGWNHQLDWYIHMFGSYEFSEQIVCLKMSVTSQSSFHP